MGPSPHLLGATYARLTSTQCMASRSHNAQRSVPQWVAWALGEGIEELSETAPSGEEQPGVPVPLAPYVHHVSS